MKPADENDSLNKVASVEGDGLDLTQTNQKESKFGTFWCLMSVYGITQTSYLNIVSLLPIFVEYNHPKFTSLTVGILFSAYQVGFLISAPFVGSLLNKTGRRRAIMVGVLIMAISNCLFAIGAYFNSAIAFYVISFLGRAGQGIADSLVLIAVPSILSNEYPKK